MARRNRDVVFVERETSSPLWWLVVGGALGAGLALLFAPDSGTRTRRHLAHRLARIRSTAEDALGEFRDAVASDDLEDELEDPESEEELDEEEVEAEEDEVEVLEEETVPSARDELERRLAAARARRQRERADDGEEPVA